MSVDAQAIASKIVADLESAWNTGDGGAFARPFAGGVVLAHVMVA